MRFDPSMRAVGSLSVAGLLLGVALLAPARQSGPGKAKPNQGEALFAKNCAKCHGAKGQGGPVFNKPLAGKLSVAQLGGFIHRTMPPGDKKTPLADAKLIAAFMHGAFYSPLAEARNRPPRVELARLTVSQFQNAVADLVDRPWNAISDSKENGLEAHYFKTGDRSEKNRAAKRVDPAVDFNFRDQAPVGEGTDPYNFSIAWYGSIIAPDTGEYDFAINSSHSARLWVNDEQQPLVDGWIRSGDQKEYRGVISLLAGRSYRLRMEFTKSTPGVDDSEKRKKNPPGPAHVRLLWRRPKRIDEPIPSRYLIPTWTPPRYVVSTRFPADDRSMGFERGSSVSKEWDESVTAAAIETAGYVETHLADVTGVPANAPDRVTKLQTYCRTFVERAFRRPLTDETREVYVDRHFKNGTPEQAVKRVVMLTLKSPRFLYREVGGETGDSYRVAADLSFGLWDSIPDEALRQAAANGELSKPEGINRQAERLAADPRAWTKLHRFLLHWLKVEEVPDIVKNSKRYPGFDDTAVNDLRTSLDLTLQEAAWTKSDYRTLIDGDQIYLNGRLAKLYGAPLKEDAPFQPAPLDEGERAGILSHPYLLARFAYLDASSPIHRGVLIARNMLGRTLAPPPVAVAPLAPSLHPGLTTRERVKMQTKATPCNSCHELINPLGFTLERFDAIGRLRKTENGKPVDASGTYQTRDGKVVQFTGAPQLATFLAESEEAQKAFVEKLFLHLVKQSPRAYGADTVDKLHAGFQKDAYSIRKLMVRIMDSTAPTKAEVR